MPATRLTSVLLPAFAIACLITALVELVSQRTALLGSIEHWTADWRAAVLADRLPGQHPGIAVVTVDDAAIDDLPYRLPVDRAWLARLVDALDAAGARVIALDFLFDKPTEPAKDAALAAAIAKARDRVVLAVVDHRTPLAESRRAWMERLVRDTGAEVGNVNLRIEIDGVARAEAEPSRLPADLELRRQSFATAIAAKAGVRVAGANYRIAWLGRPVAGIDAVMTVSAKPIVAPAGDGERRVGAILLEQLRGRVVLVGGDLEDSSDRHHIPLSKLDGKPVPGVVIHAHAVAQRLDGRRIRQVAAPVETTIVLFAATIGVLVGWLRGTVLPPWIRSAVPVAILGLLDVILFAGFRMIFPFAAPAIAWIAGIWAGQAACRLAAWRSGGTTMERAP